MAAPPDHDGSSKPFSVEQRQYLASRIVGEFIETAIMGDDFPERQAGFFGLLGDDEEFRKMMIGAWKGLILVHDQANSPCKPRELAIALFEGKMPMYFEAKVRTLPSHFQNAATTKILKEELFNRIPWHGDDMKRLAGVIVRPRGPPQGQQGAPQGGQQGCGNPDCKDPNCGRPMPPPVPQGCGNPDCQDPDCGKNEREMQMDAQRKQVRMMDEALHLMLGENYVIRHLTSEKGATLNGKVVTVVARDHGPILPEPPRMHVEMDNHDVEGGVTLLKVKPINLALPSQVDDFPPTSNLPSQQLFPMIRDIISLPKESLGERQDTVNRIGFLKQFMSMAGVGMFAAKDAAADDNKPIPGIPCMDLMQKGVIVMGLRPACAGDGQANLHRFGEGIINDSQLKDGRYQLTDDNKGHLRHRIREWCLSGMCERCQRTFLEKQGPRFPEGVAPGYLPPKETLPVSSESEEEAEDEEAKALEAALTAAMTDEEKRERKAEKRAERKAAAGVKAFRSTLIK